MKYLLSFVVLFLLGACSSTCSTSEVIATYKKLWHKEGRLLMRLANELALNKDSITSIEKYDYYFIVNTSNATIAKRYEEKDFKMNFKHLAFICDGMKTNNISIIRILNKELQIEISCAEDLHPRVYLSNTRKETMDTSTLELLDKDWAIVKK